MTGDWADKASKSLLPYSFTNGTARVEDIHKARAFVANALRETERLTIEAAAKVADRERRENSHSVAMSVQSEESLSTATKIARNIRALIDGGDHE